MTRRLRLALGVAVVVLLVGAALAIGVVIGGSGDDRASGWRGQVGTEVEAGDGIAGAPSGPGQGSDGGAREPRGVAAPAVPLAEGNARAVEFDGLLLNITTANLDVTHVLTIEGDVSDETGAARGGGTLTLSSGRIRLAGRFDLQGRPLVMTPTSARLIDYQAMLAGPIEVEADELRFRAAQRKGEAPPAEVVLPGRHAAVRVGDRTTVLGWGDAVWHDPPADMSLRGDRRRALSWTGSGAVRGHDGKPMTGERLGVKADTLSGELHRNANGMSLRADGSLLQAYVDGIPRAPTKARVDVKARPAPVAAGARGWFTWAPTNEGAFDMVVMRIAPASEPGRWVHLRLEHPPSMCGGEGCPQVGGDTGELARPQRRGLFGIGDDPDPINAVIIPHTGDERDISFTVPGGTPPGDYEIQLVLEGNFEPITVRIPVTVVPPPSR